MHPIANLHTHLTRLPETFGNGIPALWTTLLTSVWTWLYVLSGLALQSSWHLNEALDFIRKNFDVLDSPMSVMGYVAGVFVALGFYLLSLIMWLW